MNATITMRRTANDPTRWLVVIEIDAKGPVCARLRVAISTISEQEALGIVAHAVAIVSRGSASDELNELARSAAASTRRVGTEIVNTISKSITPIPIR